MSPLQLGLGSPICLPLALAHRGCHPWVLHLHLSRYTGLPAHTPMDIWTSPIQPSTILSNLLSPCTVHVAAQPEKDSMLAAQSSSACETSLPSFSPFFPLVLPASKCPHHGNQASVPLFSPGTSHAVAPRSFRLQFGT